MATATRRRPTAPSEGDTCCPPDNPQALDQLSAPKADPAADAELAAFAKALGHPVRVRILRMLAEKNARVCSRIVDELPLAQSTVSEHLRILREAGLVRVNPSGPSVGYCIVRTALTRLKALLQAL